MFRRLAIAGLLALWPVLASAQFATIAPTPATSDNGDRIATTAWANNFVNAAMPLASGKIWIGSVGNIATAQTMSQDCTIAVSGLITCLKTNNVLLGYFSTGTDAANLTGTLAAARLPAFGSGDVSFAAAGGAGTIGSHAVSSAKFRQGVALSVVGNGTSATADVTDLAAASDGQVMRRSGTAIGFGAVDLSSANAVANALPLPRLPAQGANTVLGSVAGGTPAALTAPQVQMIIGAGSINFLVRGINFNSANTDNIVPITLPTGVSRYLVNRISITNASASLSTATIGAFTATGGGGTALASTQAITVTSAAPDTANNYQSLTIAGGFGGIGADFANIYIRIGAAQGSAATGDMLIQIVPLS